MVTPQPSFPLLPPMTSERLWQAPQPEAWMAACFRGSSVWAAPAMLASAEDRAFCRVDAIAKLLLRGG